MNKQVMCEQCHKKVASAWVTKIEGSEVTKFSLCEDCLKAFSLKISINSQNLPLDSYFNCLNDKEFYPERLSNFKMCPKCQLSFADFMQTGLLGCPNCYQFFGQQLRPLLEEMHGSLEYKGKIPVWAPVTYVLNTELKALKNELFSLISQENYEAAALIRDKINTVKEKLTKA
ncbi:MAG: hypothetical protein C4562_03460 [Actinobacteria bacterium]|nr:MAG: hypothetical protein C4562_03460 [Actinomycetota bacterium]